MILLHHGYLQMIRLGDHLLESPSRRPVKRQRNSLSASRTSKISKNESPEVPYESPLKYDAEFQHAFARAVTRASKRLTGDVSADNPVIQWSESAAVAQAAQVLGLHVPRRTETWAARGEDLSDAFKELEQRRQKDRERQRLLQQQREQQQQWLQRRVQAKSIDHEESEADEEE